MKNITTKFFFTFFLTVIFIFLESCTVAKLSGRGAVPIIMNQPQAKVSVVQRVEASKQLLFDYTGAVDVSEVLRDVMIGGNIDALINVTITVKVTVGDYLLNVITLGLANARTFEVNGEAVSAPEGLSNIIDENLKPVAVFNSLNEINMENIPINNKLMFIKTTEGFFLYEYQGNL